MSFPLSGGATLAAVADIAKAFRKAPQVEIAATYSVSDEIAMDWVLQATEAGYDTGRPRDKGRGK